MNATQNTTTPAYEAVHVAGLLGFMLPVSRPSDVQPRGPQCLPGFVTFYDPGWSIVRLRDAVAKKGTIFFPQDWYDYEPFAQFDEQPRYRQLRMKALPGSFGKSFMEQQLLLPTDEVVPSARVVVMRMVIHFLATDERVFPNYSVRCIDQDLDGDRVNVGHFDADGLLVYRFWDDYNNSILGLSDSRKS